MEPSPKIKAYAEAVPERRTWLRSPASSWDTDVASELPVIPPLRILFLLVLSIFVCEVLVMVVLHFWPSLPVLTEAMIDASILVLILSPTFYWFHYQPLKRNSLEREAVLARLLQSEERLALALQAVNDGLWDWNIKDGEVYFSPRCALMLGYQPEELEPDFEGLLQLIHPEDRPCFELQLKDHLAGRLSHIESTLRLQCRSKCEDWLWVLVRGKVVERADDGTALRAVGTNTNIQARKQAEEALRQSEEGVRYLSQQLIKTSEIEKKHLAGELHDDFGQMITAFKMGVEMIRAEECTPHPAIDFHCARLLEIGRRMEASLREICDDLRPAILDDLGLTKTLAWLVERFQELHPEVHTGIEQPDLDRRLAPEIELICYRVCQEALHNIAKHAQPTEVAVTLRADAEYVHLTVRDNGRGFDPTRHRSHSHWGIGLLGMQERAAAVGGSTTVESAPGKGTTISVTLPRNFEE